MACRTGATYNSHSHHETRLYSHRCWAIPALICAIQTPGKSIISKIIMDHCIACLNSWSWRWLGCFILLCNNWFTWSCWVYKNKVTWIHLDSLVGSRCEFLSCLLAPGSARSMWKLSKTLCYGSGGKGRNCANFQYQEKQRQQSPKTQKAEKKIQEATIYRLPKIHID